MWPWSFKQEQTTIEELKAILLSDDNSIAASSSNIPITPVALKDFKILCRGLYGETRDTVNKRGNNYRQEVVKAFNLKGVNIYDDYIAPLERTML